MRNLLLTSNFSSTSNLATAILRDLQARVMIKCKPCDLTDYSISERSRLVSKFLADHRSDFDEMEDTFIASGLKCKKLGICKKTIETATPALNNLTYKGLGKLQLSHCETVVADPSRVVGPITPSSSPSSLCCRSWQACRTGMKTVQTEQVNVTCHHLRSSPTAAKTAVK